MGMVSLLQSFDLGLNVWTNNDYSSNHDPWIVRSYNYTHYQFNSQGQQFSISPYLIHMLIVDTVFVYPVDPCDIWMVWKWLISEN